jgi:peptidoglycan/LPS O-acetylase OafA/YrhL
MSSSSFRLLIASFILSEIRSGEFSLRNFYLRRIRRIFPALFAMMVASAAIGALIMTPHAYRRLGESIAATALFSSNLLFWLQSGYFAAPLEERPLLHTWSLGVEEQFYMAFPIFLMLLCRFFPSRLVGATLTLCVLSFGVNVLTVKTHSSFAFFLTPSRIWELFIGTLLAAGALAPPRSNRWSEAAGLTGVVLIGCAIFGFSQFTVFPGFAALVPTFGAALIIWAGMSGKGRVTRLLSRPAAVLVGKISYSLYLWHFPLLAFAAYVSIGGASLSMRLAMIALSITVAFASWIYIEQPVRQGRGIFGQREVVFGAAAAAAALFGGFGAVTHFAYGFPGRINEAHRQIAAAEQDINPDRGSCLQLDSEIDIAKRPPCAFGASGVPVEFALWGDSHAESLRAAFDIAAKKAGRAGIFFGNSGCIPELGIERDSSGCDRVNEAIAAHLLSLPSVHTVILAGRWGLWAEGSPYKSEAGPPISLTSSSGAPIDNHAGLAAGLQAAIFKLTTAGKHVWLVGPIPEIGYHVPRTLYLDLLGIPRTIEIRPSAREFNERQSFVFALLARMYKDYAVEAVWPHQYLCDANFCEIQKDGRPLYIDDQHLTRTAATSMAAIFDPIFANRVVSDHPVAKAP